MTMIDIANDIRSLSDFKRQTSQFMAKLRKDGSPVVLTVNGRAKIVVQDAESYQRLLERAENAEMLEFLTASRADIDAGRTQPAMSALKRLGKSKLKKRAR
jgi:prevent-host-death family protein